VVTTAVAMALTLVGDLGELANIVVLLLLLVFLSTNVSVLVLRKDRVEAEHFTAPVVLPVLAIASCLLLLWQQDGTTWLRAGLMLLVGVALYLLAQAPWWRGSEERAEVASTSGP
jgi:amino acid transporter